MRIVSALKQWWTERQIRRSEWRWVVEVQFTELFEGKDDWLILNFGMSLESAMFFLRSQPQPKIINFHYRLRNEITGEVIPSEVFGL